MAEYRDYGRLGHWEVTPALVDTNQQTQVYKVTHNGEVRLPFMYRSFISFSFGGKDIEDFDLIATVSGDRMELDGYASFDDLTSTYDVLNGQAFWGSYYRTNTLDFNLATDGIDQKTLDEFLHWFSAGKIRELILAEHPNRAIMARVAEPPHLSLLPFEKKVQVFIHGQSYHTSTTLYKGTIGLQLVVDEPHWYSKINIFGKKINGVYQDTWFDVETQRERSVLEVPDALKIVHEDGIPLSSMILSTMLLGENIFASVEERIYSNIVASISQAEYEAHEGEEGYFNNSPDDDDIEGTYYCGATIYDSTTNRGGRIAGAMMSDDSEGISALPAYKNAFDAVNFYYSGTAPSPVILKFTLAPKIDETGYICVPSNRYAQSCDNMYNTITIEGLGKKEFNFTTPNILTSYNQVISILKNQGITREGKAWTEVREVIRELVNHNAVRAWVNRAIDYVDFNTTTGGRNNTGVIASSEQIEQVIQYMQYMLIDSDHESTDSGVLLLPIAFEFNSTTGEATGQIQYRSTVIDGEIQPVEELDDFANYCKDNIVTVKENVGDMVKSKFLIIEERNYPDEQGNILAWERDKTYAHRLYHNVSTGLTHISLDYKNMYL